MKVLALLCSVLLVLQLTAPAHAQRVRSAQGCLCATDCVLNICTVDASVCGTCPTCVGVSAFGRCLGFCTDSCKPPSNPIDDIIQGTKTLFDNIVSKFNDFFDNVGDSALVQRIQSEIKLLPAKLQTAIQDASQVATLRLDELNAFSEETMAHMKAVRGLTSEQLKKLVARLKNFDDSNLANFLNLIDGQAFKASVKEFGCISDWSDAQSSALANKAISVLGAVTGWSPDQIKEIGHLVKGLSQGDIRALPPLAFKAGVIVFSAYTGGVLKPAQVEAIALKAKDVFGQVSKWDRNTWRAMGNLVVGLTTGDLSQADVQTIGELARVAGWNQAQVQAIASRAIALIGNITQADGKTWQKIAAFAGGMAQDQLLQVSDVGLQALGRLNILDITQWRALSTRAISLLGKPSGWSADEWKLIGNAAKGLAVAELNDLPYDGIRALGKFTDIDVKVAQAAFDRAKVLLGDPRSWTPEKWQALGESVRVVTTDIIASVDQAALRNILSASSLTPDQITAAITRLKTLRGNLTTWTPQDWESLGNKITSLKPEDLRRIGSTALAVVQKYTNFDALQLTALSARAVELLGDVRSWRAEDWQRFGDLAFQLAVNQASALNKTQISVLSRAIRNLPPSKLDAIRGRLVTVYGSIEQIKPEDWAAIGNLAKSLTSGDLQTVARVAIPYLRDIVPKVLNRTANCRQESLLPIANVDWCPSQLEAISRRALAIYGEVKDWKEDDWREMGALIRGLPNADLETIPENAFDFAAAVTGWDKQRLKCLVTRAIQLFQAGKGLAAWGKAEFDRLKGLVAGLTPEQIKSLTAEQFEAAVSQFGQVTTWDNPQLVELVNKAKEVYGSDVSKWSSTVVGKMNTIVSGLDNQEVAQIAPAALASVSADALSVMCDQKRLRALTPDQLSSLSTEQAGAVCSQEQPYFTTSQLAAVQSSQSGGGSGGNKGAIAAAVIIPTLVLGLILVAVYLKRNKRSSTAPKASQYVAPASPSDPAPTSSPSVSVSIPISAPAPAPAPAAVPPRPPVRPVKATAPETVTAPVVATSPRAAPAPRPIPPPVPTSRPAPAARPSPAPRPVPVPRPRKSDGEAIEMVHNPIHNHYSESGETNA